jgi:outer membrane protein OmpA-like peptidoglycan-associated protein
VKRHSQSVRLATAAASTLLGLAACETAPESNQTLEQARAAVAKAEVNPSVAKFAATELERARKLLINAEGAMEGGSVNRVISSHYAYLATQMAHIAEQRAAEQGAIARIQAGETERQQILLSAREREAAQARAQARTAQAQALEARGDAQRAQVESQRLAAQLQDLEAAQTPRGIVLTLDDVLFDTGRAVLKPGAQRSVDQIAAFLNENPERQVQIEGFTDSQGADDFNLELSQSRADAVARAIIQRGVDAQRVRAQGYGEEFPVASNVDAGSRQLNRRVEVIVSNDDGVIPGRTPSGSP